MKRNAILISVLVFVLLAAGIIFLPGWISSADEQDLPLIVLPEQGPDFEVPSDIVESNTKLVERIEIDVSSVQEVLKALKRPQEYSYTAETTYFYGDASRTLKTEGFVKGDHSKTIVYGPDGEKARETILTPDTVYSWASGSATFYSGKVGTFTQDDLGLIPTYEEIVALPKENILAAGFDDEGNTLLSVEVSNPISGYIDKYVISVEFGLLITSSSFDGDKQVYKTELGGWATYEHGIPADTFTLPTGALPPSLSAG